MHRARPRNGFSLIEILIVFMIISILVSLLLPVIMSSRDAARRTQCENNFKQILLAFSNYHDTYRMLPPGSVDKGDHIDNVDEGYHASWIVQILPYIEQRWLGNAVDTSVGVYNVANNSVSRTMITSLLCPADRGPDHGDVGQGLSSYAACHNDKEGAVTNDDHGTFFLNSWVRYEGILDGTSQTIFLGEKMRYEGDLGWMSGTRATLRNAGTPINSGDLCYAAKPIPTWGPDGRGLSGPPLQPDREDIRRVGGFASAHEKGANFGFGDGSVRYLSETIQRDLFQRLANRADGGMINDSDF